MTTSNTAKEPTEFGRRVLLAIEEEGRTQTSTERDSGLGRGYLSRLIKGTRGATSVNPEHMARLAQLLRVNFEWLVVGTGPMRHEGAGSTPLDEAVTFARRQGAREDAIQSAIERNRDRAADLSATDWILAIDVEARRLDRSGAMRPEDAADKRQAIKRAKKKLDSSRKREEDTWSPDENHPPAKSRAVGDRVR